MLPSRGRGCVFHQSSISPHMRKDPSSVYLWDAAVVLTDHVWPSQWMREC